MPLAVDTETTGLDLHHGCRPFMVTACDGERSYWWEWSVDPTNRTVSPPEKELREIRTLIENADSLIFHNALFDVTALEKIGVLTPQQTGSLDWWGKIHETTIASHAIDSSGPHGLKELALVHLDIPDDDQQAMRDATNEARRIARKLEWNIARPEHPHFPATIRAPKAGWWVMDTWLPRQICLEAERRVIKFLRDSRNERIKQLREPDPWVFDYAKDDHPWRTVTRTYGVQDAERTFGLWKVFYWLLHEQKVWTQYTKRLALLPGVYRMQQRGITLNASTLREQAERFEGDKERSRLSCLNLAEHRIDNLDSSKQLQGLLYGTWGLHPVKSTVGGAWATDKDSLASVAESCEPRSKPAAFLRNLARYKKCGTAIKYLDGYRLSGIDVPLTFRHGDNGPYLRLHPTFNITGTATTRFSSQNPNAQNISKQDEFNLRTSFGPLPGREWYSIDYENIELRIFAYCSGDRQLIDAFERGEVVMLIFAKAVYPVEFAECERKGISFKERYKATLYQWVKNGTYCLIYGGSPAKVDATFRKAGAYDLIARHLPGVKTFMDSKYREAKRHGFVTCLNGYRLTVEADKPHVAVNYFVQGTAGECLILAMSKIDGYLRTLHDHYMIMCVHDELDFDFPIHPRNKSIVSRVCDIMRSAGDVIGLPTPVSVSRITTSWAGEVSTASPVMREQVYIPMRR